MKRYNFRLQRVLDIREVVQKKRERELASAITMLESEKNTLFRLREKLKNYQDDIRERRRSSIFEMRFYSSYFSWLFIEIHRQIERVSNCENNVGKSKLELGNAYKEKKAIENLKQRTRDEFIREFEKDEGQQNDEISLVKYFHKESYL